MVKKNQTHTCHTVRIHTINKIQKKRSGSAERKGYSLLVSQRKRVEENRGGHASGGPK